LKLAFWSTSEPEIRDTVSDSGVTTVFGDFPIQYFACIDGFAETSGFLAKNNNLNKKQDSFYQLVTI